MDEIDLWRAAKVVVDLFGDEATAHACSRSMALLEQGDREGAAAWRRITTIIGQLEATQPGKGETVQ